MTRSQSEWAFQRLLKEMSGSNQTNNAIDRSAPPWEDSLDEKYPHIVYEELCKSCDAEDVPEGEHHLNDIEEEMIKGLSTVSGNQPRSTLLKKY
ncbi:unnamed protein product [Brassica oleracea]|uniref:(rape) hypothetical protein n=1 Tax=Brassica napus TaxID=3708 RepID=A0A816KJS1_BRANA|nr:unnamed protein product [Brassica napus]